MFYSDFGIVMRIIESLNTREQSTLFWLGVFIVWAMSNKDIRTSALGVVRAFFALKWYLLSFVIYLSLVIFLVSKYLSLSPSLVKIVIFWILGSAFVMFLDAPRLLEGKNRIKKILKDVVGLTVLITVISGLYTFPLLIELAIVPLVALFAALAAYGEVKNERKVAGIANGVLAVAGVLTLTYAGWNAMVFFSGSLVIAAAEELILPVVLSFMLLPYLLVLSLYARLERQLITRTHLK